MTIPTHIHTPLLIYTKFNFYSDYRASSENSLDADTPKPSKDQYYDYYKSSAYTNPDELSKEISNLSVSFTNSPNRIFHYINTSQIIQALSIASNSYFTNSFFIHIFRLQFAMIYRQFLLLNSK